MPRRPEALLAALALALLLSACGTPPAPTPAGPPPSSPRVTPSAPAAPGAQDAQGASDTPAAAPATPASDTPLMPATPLAEAGVRWLRAEFADLPGWASDRALQLWPALLRGCARPAPLWRELCARAALESPADDAAARRFLQTWLRPWQLQTADGRSEGLATGYFEPELDAVRQRREGFEVALHAPPADLATRRPHFSRQELDTLPAAQATLAGRELAWINDPVDLLLLQIQGSGRLRLIEPDGRITPLRVAFAGHNAQPYRSPGRWLVEQGELRVDSVSWGTIRAWAIKFPQRLPELMWSNPRVVYFRLEPLPDPQQGPRGAQGVPLTPMRSVAIDPRAVPYGSPMWISTTDPLANAPLQRLVMAQDTGGAILGAVRIDLFTGWGDDALVLASRLKQPLRAWVLWPRTAAPPRQSP
ncbi:MAG: MltA domain-containing protein [Rubrivivax sp.]|nr:MltA domain-containing protein [Rubrivivax sp.]